MSRPGRPRFSTLAAVRRELAELYADARAGMVPTADASRLGYLLAQLRQALESEQLAERVERLEALIQARE